MNTTRRIRIKVRGRLSDRLAASFDGMTVLARADASELVGPVVDQAQLHGLLGRIRDLGLELESVTTEAVPQPTGHAACRVDQAAAQPASEVLE
jgi:hypothetical protein